MPSGVAYSLAKGVADMPIDWCIAPERGLPRPDITLFLDIEPEHANIQSTREDFGQERYEVSEFQVRVRACFKEILGDGEKNSGVLDMGKVITIDACKDIKTVAADIWQAVQSQDVESSEIATIT